MITITAPLCGCALRLGKQGENEARQIAFDVSGWAKLYGSGTVVLLHQRSEDTEPYPVSLTLEDGIAAWVVSSVDTLYSGKGSAELQYIVEDALAKSVTYRTYVAASLSSSTDVPDAYESWLDSLTTMAAQTQTNAEDAADSADSAAESASAAAASAESAAASAAATSATAASGSAESAASAATSATAASGSAESAASAATAAMEYAGTAATSAETASSAATTAGEYASAASTYAGSAATSASEAATSESNAKSSASAAATSESNAKNSADAAADSATAASDSATTATEAAETATEAAESAASNAETVAEIQAAIVEDVEYALLAGFDGTAYGYRNTMRTWFRAHGSDDATAAELTALCDQWYNITRPSWDGNVAFYQPDVSAVTTGTKGGDNADLTCTPSTDTVANQDDYAGLPLFACVDCNWEVDADTLQPVITAIDGVTDSFTRTDPEVYVGVLQMSGYHYWYEDSETYTHGYTANPGTPYANIEPVPEAVNPDGTFRQWVVHSKYMSKTVDGKMTSYSGVIPAAFVSHNTAHTLSAVNGSQYSGGTTADLSWLVLMAYIKYGSLTLDGILQGCCNMNYQYVAQVAEEGVNRIILSTTNAANLEVGMSVLLGNYAGSTDRGQSAMCSISGNGGCRITAIETITVDDTEYSAVYVDLEDTFDTAANGSATEGTTYLSSWHWATGSCDDVLGNDGSPVSCTSGKYPAKLQGIEYMSGGYEVLADVILSLYSATDDEDNTTYYYEPYICRLRANQSTSITSNYVATGLAIAQPSSAAWGYIKQLQYAMGVFFPASVGGSSSTYTRDAFYQNAAATGTREWLAFGYLDSGVASGGLSCLLGYRALSIASWYSLARLSPNGNRGELAAA